MCRVRYQLASGARRRVELYLIAGALRTFNGWGSAGRGVWGRTGEGGGAVGRGCSLAGHGHPRLPGRDDSDSFGPGGRDLLFQAARRDSNAAFRPRSAAAGAWHR